MAKRKVRKVRQVRLNPADARSLEGEIDDSIFGSGTTIDSVYEELNDLQLDLDHYEGIRKRLEANDESIPSGLRSAISANKSRIKELDRRIVQYGNLMLRRIKDRMNIVRNSPGAAFNQRQIREVDRDVFRLEKKLDLKGSDIRKDIVVIMGKLVTLEQDSGIVISRPSQKADPELQRRSEDAVAFAALIEQWKKVYNRAKSDQSVGDDVEWVTAQIRSLDSKFKRGESIRKGIEGVARRVRNIHLQTRSKQPLRDYASAQEGIRDFASVVREYSKGKVDAAGIDKLEYQLEQFSRQFTPQSKAEWSNEDRRKFASDLKSLRDILESLRPKRRVKKNPCVGLHFHGKDTDEILHAIEKSNARLRLNPRRKKPKEKSRPKSRKIRSKKIRRN